jgi:hypothetical protein
VREGRRATVAFLILMTLLAFAFILGPHTPIYYVAFRLVPGIGRFRAPTRFMVVVELGLVLLAAVGLTRLRGDLQRRWAASRIPAVIAAAICAATALDLFVHQPRQNSIVSARDWLAPPPTVDIVRADSPAPRTFTPHHRDVHREVHEVNRGWTHIEPYFKLRDLLAPDTGVYWNVPSADCYVGLIPRWYVMVWGYHYYENSFIADAAFEDFDRRLLTMKPGFMNLMRTYGVTHLLSALPGSDPGLTPIAAGPNAYVYRVEGAARVRVVRAAVTVPSEAHAVARVRDATFDPDREIVLLDAPAATGPGVHDTDGGPPGGAGHATITHDDSRGVVIDAVAQADGFLLLADLFFPGWTATVDGVETPIYRANVSVRGIALPKGRHTIRFRYESAPFARGLRISTAAIAGLLAWFAVAAYGARK